MDRPRVCIIGAGTSGIVAAKTLYERGIAYDWFEKGSTTGGLWRYNNDSGQSAAYRSLHINTSRDKMAFSDFPMPRSFPDYPHHTQVAEYFDRYIQHFGFGHTVTFRTTVLRVEPLADGSFDVTTESYDGARTTRNYAAVLVANGHHWKPRQPEFPGSFDGRILHSHAYRSPEEFAGQRVLVVGLGNSACDIACEVSRIAATTLISARRGVHVIPKYILGKPVDRLAPAWMWRYLPFRVFQLLFELMLRLARGSGRRFRLPRPEHRILEEHPTISNDLLSLIGHGRIEIRPGIAHLAGERVRFVDGREDTIDTIICATGYQIATPFLDEAVFSAPNNEVRLFEYVIHPEYPRLFFLGLVQPWGAVAPLAEEQARWIAKLLDGECKLPSRQAMTWAMDRARHAMRRRYVSSPRHTIQVDFFAYQSSLRRLQRRTRGTSIALDAGPIVSTTPAPIPSPHHTRSATRSPSESATRGET